MSRRIHALVALALVGFSFAAAACADTTAPQPASNVSADATCDWQSNNTCRH
jgi:hypothetical protein